MPPAAAARGGVRRLGVVLAVGVGPDAHADRVGEEAEEALVGAAVGNEECLRPSRGGGGRGAHWRKSEAPDEAPPPFPRRASGSARNSALEPVCAPTSTVMMK